jgi:hypothetical protein
MGHLSYIVRDLEAQGIRLPKVRMSKPACVEIARPAIVRRLVLPKNVVAERRALVCDSGNELPLTASIAEAVAAVSAECQISAKEILGRSREHAVTIARQEVYLRALDAGLNISEIAKALGRDRTAIVLGINAAAVRRSKAGAK